MSDLVALYGALGFLAVTIALEYPAFGEAPYPG
jgi:hypothetical protein